MTEFHDGYLNAARNIRDNLGVWAKNVEAFVEAENLRLEILLRKFERVTTPSMDYTLLCPRCGRKGPFDPRHISLWSCNCGAVYSTDSSRRRILFRRFEGPTVMGQKEQTAEFLRAQIAERFDRLNELERMK